MGHVRLGTLPKTRAWKEVIGLIADGADVSSIADATMRAADKAFEAIQNDKGFAEAVELMTHLAIAARKDNPADHLDSVGIRLSAQSSIVEVAITINRALDEKAARNGSRSDFGELAQGALVGAVVEHLSARFGTMFAPTSSEIKAALSGLGKNSEFGKLSSTFFSKLTYSAIDYFLSHTIGTQIGEGQRFATTNQVAQFKSALDVHCHEAAVIVEKFSGEWFSKNYFQNNGSIPKKKTEGFGWFAMKKMREELKQRANTNGSRI